MAWVRMDHMVKRGMTLAGLHGSHGINMAWVRHGMSKIEHFMGQRLRHGMESYGQRHDICVDMAW